MSHNFSHQSQQPVNHEIYACLPFIELAHESIIKMGPITFWPASKYPSFLPSEAYSNFRQYIQSIGQIKTQIEEQKMKWINTVRLAPQGTTCISIDSSINIYSKEILLIDSIYLLYFACVFRNLYYSNEIPPFDGFRKMIPASLDFIQNKTNWEHLYIKENHRVETVCIHLFDHEICNGLGKMLLTIYHPITPPSSTILSNYKRLIRSIRYLVDRFFQRFINLFEKGLKFSEDLFEPEDVIFLVSSFEALFDINDRHPNADFKQKLRPLLHLKYSKPVEIFWKWVDDFYEVRRKIVHGGLIPDPIFRVNPNFEVSHILIGIKLFIYSVYYTFFKYHLIPSAAFDAYTPPDFKWIHPEEILLFFWTESHLLHKLNTFITQAKKYPQHEELYADIHLLTNLFISMYERYYKTPHFHEGIKFIPTPIAEIAGPIQNILRHIRDKAQDDPFHTLLLKHISPEFILYLEERMADFHKKNH